MKKLLFASLLFQVLFLNIARAQWSNIGPSGGNINCTARAGNMLFAGTSKGLFRSTDGGEHYQPFNNNQQFDLISSIFFDDTVLYVATAYDQLFTSRDTGRSWTLMKNAPGSFNYYSMFFKLNNKVFWNGSTQYYTTDHGNTWTVLKLPVFMDDVSLLKMAGGILFRTEDKTLYRSADEGRTWEMADTLLPKNQIINIIAVKDTLFLFFQSERVFVSVDGGINWKAMTNFPPTFRNIWDYPQPFSPKSICYNGKTFFSCTTNASHLFMLRPGDTQWVATKRQYIADIQTVFNLGEKVYGYGSYHLYRLSAGEDSLELMCNTGFIPNNISLVLADGDKLLAVGTNEIYSSHDGGITWAASLSRATPPASCLTFLNNMVYSSSSDRAGVLRSSDFGLSWNSSGLRDRYINALTNDGTNLYAAGDLSRGDAAYISKDGGLNWDDFQSGWTQGAVTKLMVMDNFIYASMFSQNRSPVLTRSSTGISNWMAFTKGLPSDGAVALAGINNKIYTGTAENGIFSSSGNDPDWTPLNKGLERHYIRDLLASGSDLYATTDSGIFMLPGGNSEWQDITFNISTRTLLQMTSNGTYLFVSSFKDNIWRIPLKALGVKAPKENALSFNIFPNPCDEKLAISDMQLAGGDRVEVLDINGRLIINKSIKETTDRLEISTAELVNGLYFFRIVKGNNIYTRKFVVQH
jgi:photosystem II stability/assembly factor-like uncharacterized protein